MLFSELVDDMLKAEVVDAEMDASLLSELGCIVLESELVESGPWLVSWLVK